MLATNCNVQGTTANLPNVFHHTRCKKISEESQDTFTCQTTNVNSLGGGRGYKLRGLIHNHSAAKTFSTDASRQHICHYEGFWHILITGQRYKMMLLLIEVEGNSVPAEYGHYPPLTRALAFSYYFGFYLLKINPEIFYDTILFAFIPFNCCLQKIILISHPPWNKLSEWKMTSGLQAD